MAPKARWRLITGVLQEAAVAGLLGRYDALDPVRRLLLQERVSWNGHYAAGFAAGCRRVSAADTNGHPATLPLSPDLVALLARWAHLSRRAALSRTSPYRRRRSSHPYRATPHIKFWVALGGP